VLTHGVRELNIDVGPGYCVYYTERAIALADGLLEWMFMTKVPASKTKTSAKTRTKTVPYDVAEQLRSPEEMAAYLDAWLEEAPDDISGVARALGDIARAKGMSQVARDSGLSRESLYKALSETGNPTFATVLKVARAVGLKFHAQAA
jgi:probable addiction module antidote protein